MESVSEGSRFERAKAFASVHAEARYKAGKSQEYMAMELGVSRKTVQNWEKGISSPTFFQSIEWFRILQINPMPLFMELVLHMDKSDISLENIDKTLIDILDQFTVETKLSLLFLFLGDHGSSPSAVLQMVLAHLHSPLKARVIQAQTIAQTYSMEKDCGNIICPDEILPNMERLWKAIENGRKSAVHNLERYAPMDEE